MGETIIGGLLLAFVLQLFNIHNVFIVGMREMFNLDVSKQSYFLTALVISIIVGLIREFTNRCEKKAYLKEENKDEDKNGIQVNFFNLFKFRHYKD